MKHTIAMQQSALSAEKANLRVFKIRAIKMNGQLLYILAVSGLYQ